MKVQSIQISECHRAKALAGALIDGELQPETALALERHMGGCGSCRQFLAEVARLKLLVRAAVRRCSPPRGMKGRIRARLAAGA
ncbi:MAG: zf-HC2 domain-containing protein [Acidobacteria bacterium]|nr:zf-HC2 domain-containing protein [Acidobacteriota bacterium]